MAGKGVVEEAYIFKEFCDRKGGISEWNMQLFILIYLLVI